MPITDVTIWSRCSHCRQVVSETTVKKDNMRLMVSELVWCESCGAETPEVREVAGRQSALEAERASYPGNPPVPDLSAAEYRRWRESGSVS
jgi:hypothetical protein